MFVRALAPAILAMFVLSAPAFGQDAPPPLDEAIAPIVQQFAIDRSDRMTVQVQVNGSEAVPFIVDTGAERTVIANELARKLLLEAGPRLTLATISGKAEVNSFFIEKLTTAAVWSDQIWAHMGCWA
jgi:predicted aspartyl protease